MSERDAAGQAERRDRQIKRAMAAEPRIGRDGLRIASLGTAFYVDGTGKLLTNNHVVVDCKAVTVLTEAGEEHPARVLAIDAKQDLALLQADATTRAVAVFAPDSGIGHQSFVATVGYPNQGLPPREPLVTEGVLLGVAGQGLSAGHLVIRADIRKGNSGGPIFDDRGRVIGLLYAKINPARVYDATGLDVEDTGLGIPLSSILEFLRRNDARFRQGRGEDTLETSQILTLARQFVCAPIAGSELQKSRRFAPVDVVPRAENSHWGTAHSRQCCRGLDGFGTVASLVEYAHSFIFAVEGKRLMASKDR